MQAIGHSIRYKFHIIYIYLTNHNGIAILVAGMDRRVLAITNPVNERRLMDHRECSLCSARRCDRRGRLFQVL